ncbi:hypothetical protein FIBSPDRAFT_904014 [Athelia psychrophila]|uniref:RBR-type E3 ubiquitin transferase n=1 Tax=Athelia psychrophila TaxID=1759441 RepID=A0A167V9V6_9AGAM|nr:hypothetical protein FIBSPDRAFT_904014 [Fibularhizoctonia sp. CBS 109695]
MRGQHVRVGVGVDDVDEGERERRERHVGVGGPLGIGRGVRLLLSPLLPGRTELHEHEIVQGGGERRHVGHLYRRKRRVDRTWALPGPLCSDESNKTPLPGARPQAYSTSPPSWTGTFAASSTPSPDRVLQMYCVRTTLVASHPSRASENDHMHDDPNTPEEDHVQRKPRRQIERLCPLTNRFVELRRDPQEVSGTCAISFESSSLVYGERGSIEAARALVNSELARLESQEQTVLLKRQSVRFFVTRGLAILKEELGDENATLIVSPFPAKIIIKGGDAARHTLNRLIEESLDASNIVPRTGDTEEAVCPICYDAVTSPMELGCGHAYCSACIRHFLTSASTFPLVCMGDEDTCHVPIPIPVVQRFLPIQQFTNILETAFITYIDHHPRDFKYCTTPDCRQVYRCTTSETVSIIHCPACLSSVCSTCHEEGHEGMTCSQRKLLNDPEEQERLSDEFATQSGYKKCPQCTVWIEKTKGCNHMTCKCGTHICWVCMGIFDAASVNKHIRAAHGGIHEANRSRAEPPFQPDFAGQQETARLFALRRATLAQQQRQQAEEDQRRLAQQLLDARQLREREDARRQEEARIAALAQQQRHDAEDARHRLAQQLLHERQKQEDARTEEVRTAARLRQAKQLLDARRLREQEDARIEEVRTAAQRQRLAAEDARHRLAVRLRDARQVQDREDARMQDEARKAELSRGVAERRRAEEAGLRRAEEADLRRAAAARRQDQEPEATEEGCVCGSSVGRSDPRRQCMDAHMSRGAKLILNVQRQAAEDARHRVAVNLRNARMQDEARKAELSKGVAERRRAEEAGLRRAEEADLRRAAAARRQDQEPEATEEGCVFQAWVAVTLADSAWMRT